MLIHGKAHADDITVLVREAGSGKTRTARLWVYVRDDRNAGSQMSTPVWFCAADVLPAVASSHSICGNFHVLFQKVCIVLYYFFEPSFLIHPDEYRKMSHHLLLSVLKNFSRILNM